jgi:DNA (cytosine-5)-methyltransferase 1
MSLPFTSVELCAGAGGQALGIERAGFSHVGLVEIDRHACATLKENRPQWSVICGDIGSIKTQDYKGVELLAGGLPCPPFSIAGKQLGRNDERDLFPVALRLADEIRPRAIMIENVRGILDPIFQSYREEWKASLRKLGYLSDWRLLNASDFGVPQLRPRVVFVALRSQDADGFEWPSAAAKSCATVGETLRDLMATRGWEQADSWAARANQIAPTIVGGSKKHGGPDLGPTRAKRAWAALGVDGHGIADHAPPPMFFGMPRLTVRMVARLQGFPDTWKFVGGKTNSYRQVGNAFPPPVATAVAERIAAAFRMRRLVASAA